MLLQALTDFEKAVEITIYGMVGIFAFMIIFYFSIKAIDTLFPKKIEK